MLLGMKYVNNPSFLEETFLTLRIVHAKTHRIRILIHWFYLDVFLIGCKAVDSEGADRGGFRGELHGTGEDHHIQVSCASRLNQHGPVKGVAHLVQSYHTLCA